MKWLSIIVHHQTSYPSAWAALDETVVTVGAVGIQQHYFVVLIRLISLDFSLGFDRGVIPIYIFPGWNGAARKTFSSEIRPYFTKHQRRSTGLKALSIVLIKFAEFISPLW